MTVADIIERAREDGVTLVLDPAGKLKVRGNDAAVARWLPAIREHKPALLRLLSEPRRLWAGTHPDGRVFSHSMTPPATLAEVGRWYPDALSIEPEPAPPDAGPSGCDDADLAAVRGWLARIGETDRGIIAETLDRCRQDPAALAYFMGKARGTA